MTTMAMTTKSEGPGPLTIVFAIDAARKTRLAWQKQRDRIATLDLRRRPCMSKVTEEEFAKLDALWDARVLAERFLDLVIQSSLTESMDLLLRQPARLRQSRRASRAGRRRHARRDRE